MLTPNDTNPLPRTQKEWRGTAGGNFTGPVRWRVFFTGPVRWRVFLPAPAQQHRARRGRLRGRLFPLSTVNFHGLHRGAQRRCSPISPRSGQLARDLAFLRDEEAAGSNPATPTGKRQVTRHLVACRLYCALPVSDFGSPLGANTGSGGAVRSVPDPFPRCPDAPMSSPT
jgi:hypothetical protein